MKIKNRDRVRTHVMYTAPVCYFHEVRKKGGNCVLVKQSLKAIMDVKILSYLEVLMNPNISILVIVNVVCETIDHVIDNLVQFSTCI